MERNRDWVPDREYIEECGYLDKTLMQSRTVKTLLNLMDILLSNDISDENKHDKLNKMRGYWAECLTVADIRKDKNWQRRKKVEREINGY